MTDTVYLHYTQTELDRNFDQRGWVQNSEEVIARYGPSSAAVRERLRCLTNVPYGKSPDQVLDIFPAAASASPVLVFVHGGRWVNFTKDDNSLVAGPLVDAGIHCVVLNFSKLPAVRLPQMVEQVRQGVEWTWRHAKSFGGDPDRLFISGHSSGAHLAAMSLVADWRARGLPADLIKAATLVSGPYDMVPVMLSARSSYVKLETEEIPQMSPQHLAGDIRCPVTLIHAEGDTDEFRRQSRAFASVVEAAGRLREAICVPAMNHFEIMESFGDAGSVVSQTLIRMVAST
jgi:arylformamidase